jgi:hypothetical protein
VSLRGRNPAPCIMPLPDFSNLQTDQMISKHQPGPYPLINLSRRSGRPLWRLSLNWNMSPLGPMTARIAKVRTSRKTPQSRARVLSFLAVPSPPLSPTVYLTLHPWTLPEYLLLLSIKPLGSKNDDISWDEVASKLNEDTRYPQRSAWDCWHRWVVPWCRSRHASKPRRKTYPHAPGVQHEYKFADLEGLIELWAPVLGAVGISPGVTSESPHAFPAPKTPAVQHRRAWGRAHHPGAHSAPFISCACSLCTMKAYPPHSAPPNVPSRTLGDACERGLAPWFTLSAVNTPVLQRVLESQPDRTENWLPVHLRGRTVPPPSLPMGATPDSE